MKSLVLCYAELVVNRLQVGSRMGLPMAMWIWYKAICELYLREIPWLLVLIWGRPQLMPASKVLRVLYQPFSNYFRNHDLPLVQMQLIMGARMGHTCVNEQENRVRFECIPYLGRTFYFLWTARDASSPDSLNLTELQTVAPAQGRWKITSQHTWKTRFCSHKNTGSFTANIVPGCKTIVYTKIQYCLYSQESQ